MRQGTQRSLFLAHPREEEFFLYPDASSSLSSRPPRVLIVGVGALGCPVAEILASDGSVSLTLIDDDRVETSNLQRQVLFDDEAIGHLKASAAADALRRRFPDTRVVSLDTRFAADNAPTLVVDHDIVIDACDDPETKLLINEACVAADTPFVYGGVMRTGGQTMAVAPGASACLACVFPDLADPDGAEDGDLDSCSRMGILAPVAGVVGSLQALAALEMLEGRGRPGRMQIYEIRGARWRSVDFDPRPGCPACDSATARGGAGDSEPRRQETCLT